MAVSVPHMTIIGGGRVGGSIAKRLRNKGVEVAVINSNGFDEWLASGIVGSVLILAVKDDVMREIVDDVAGRKGESLRGVVAFHVNGSLGASILSSWASKGALVGAAHPFQTFNEADPSALDGIGWGVDASGEAWVRIKEVVELTGGRPVRLSDTTDIGKRRYHASAVAASNFAYAAYELGRRLADSVGIDADVFLVPIMKRTFENAADALHDEEPFGITGPLIRGDVEGVRKQLAAIPEDLKPLYCHLSRALLAVVKYKLPPETVKDLENTTRLL